MWGSSGLSVVHGHDQLQRGFLNRLWSQAAGTQRLRYSGVVGDADVEVKSLGAVTVTKDESTGEIVITTADATIRIKPGAKAPKAAKGGKQAR